MQELFELPPVFFQIYQRRMGRIWAGAAGILGALVLVGCILYSTIWLESTPRDWNFGGILIEAALFPVAAYFISQLFVGRLLLRKLLSPYFPQKDSRMLLEQLKNLSVQKQAEQAAQKLERLSIGLPLVALSLLAPLTIQMLVSFPFLLRQWPTDFSTWILISLIVVGHCHLLLAWLSWRHSEYISKASVEDFALMPSHGWRILGIVVASSPIAAVIFQSALAGFLIMFLVSVTGVLFVPSMYGWARGALAYERTELELALDLKNVIKRL